ncbi:MAG: TrkA family potassium uptake protein [Theionarchaea archaeon]|nr:TrkA family potassium uptake protein [Theionarchaea archaeon]
MFVIVAGANLMGKEVTKILVKSSHDVVVIDKNRDTCESVYAETGAMTIHGNATDIHVLEEAGAAKTEVIICLMQDADNLACALLSRSLGIPRIIARLRDPHYEQAYQQAGVTTTVNAAGLLLDQIMMEIEQPRIKRIMTLGGGKAGIYMVRIPEKARSVGMKIKDITGLPIFPRECVFMGIYHEDDGSFLIPRGDYAIREEDTIFLISKPHYIEQATDVLTKV